MPRGLLSIFLLLLLLSCVADGDGGVADPVDPCYDLGLVRGFFQKPLIPNNVTSQELGEREAVQVNSYSCLRGTKNTQHGENRLITNFPASWHEDLRNGTNFLPTTTFWINEFLHVGHLMYDLVLLQLLQVAKIDRIVLQRPICHGSLCSGLGVMDSFFKGYFAAILDAAGQMDTPVYVRFHAKTDVLTPLYFSTTSSNTYVDSAKLPQKMQKPIVLEGSMCFERLYRASYTHFGATPTISRSAAEKFKKSAYKLLRGSEPVTSFFSTSIPYTILFSYRGKAASRHIDNIDESIAWMRQNFPSPTFDLRLLDNSNITLDFATQMRAVAEAHVVITNHGAFESNLIYMKNSSLLIEIFGTYGNNEIHTFNRMALMFGLYYARIQPKALTNHHSKSFVMSQDDFKAIGTITKTFFEKRPFLHTL